MVRNPRAENHCASLDDIMTLHILGGGSIGLLYASSMRLVSTRKFPICLLLQAHHAPKLKLYNEPISLDQGFVDESILLNLSPSSDLGHPSSEQEGNNKTYIFAEMKDVHGKIHLQDIPSEIINGEHKQRDIQNVLLATKAPQAVTALESIFPRFHPTEQINIVCMTNGSLGVVDGIQASLKDNGLCDKVNIIYASTTHGAMRGRGGIGDAFSVVHTGLGHTFIEGSADSNDADTLQQTLCTIWNDYGLRCSIISPEEMYVMNWKKLATNCAINPLTALRQCENGKLLATKSKSLSYDATFDSSELDYNCDHLFYQLIREVSDVAMAEADKSSANLSSSVKKELSYDNLVSFVESVVHQTSRNKSSMLQDVIARRYPTEIMFLNGYISRIGRDNNLDVKANSYVCEEIERGTNIY